NNADGIKNGADAGLANRTLTLFDASNAVVGTATTDTNGNFTIANVGPGTLHVVETLPTGVALTTTPPPAFQAMSGMNVSGLLFGNFTQAVISGQVFTDNNGNGIKDGADAGLAAQTVKLLDASNNVVATTSTDTGGSDPGINGATIQLYLDVNGNGAIDVGTDTLAGTATTSASGAYSITGVGPGSYLLQEAPAHGRRVITPPFPGAIAIASQ